jgi:hypothetical protein
MNRIRSRQIARLEKRAVPYIKQREGIRQKLRNLRRGAVAHATVLALLVRYGNPRLGEPLSCAGGRVAKSEFWGLFCQKFPPDRTIYPDDFEYLFPFTRDQVTIIGDELRHVSIATFPGADEKEKLNLVLQSAPPWLLWFTFADYSAKLLGLSLPDLSTVSRFERSNEIFQGWWGLPQSAYECHPWPHGIDGEALARTDLSLFELETGQEMPVTKRERTRALAHASRSNLGRKVKWPTLISAERLRLDYRTGLALLGRAGIPEFAGHGQAPTRRHLK